MSLEQWAVVTQPLTLTYEMLRHAYESASIGAECPTMGIISASHARALGLVYDVDVDDVEAVA